MKRKLFVALISLLSLLLTLCSCSCKGAWDCTETKCRNCGADCLECIGCANDLVNCVPFFLCGEECTDTCGVAPCFTLASGLRTNKNCACSTQGFLEDLQKLEPGDYSVSAHLGPAESIFELRYYSKRSYGFSVWAINADLKDVVVEYSFEDSYGNRVSHALLYIDDFIKAGEYSDSVYAIHTVSAENGRIDGFPAGGFDPDITTLVEQDSSDSNGYKALVTIHCVYGRY